MTSMFSIRDKFSVFSTTIWFLWSMCTTCRVQTYTRGVRITFCPENVLFVYLATWGCLRALKTKSFIFPTLWIMMSVYNLANGYRDFQKIQTTFNFVRVNDTLPRATLMFGLVSLGFQALLLGQVSIAVLRNVKDYFSDKTNDWFDNKAEECQI